MRLSATLAVITLSGSQLIAAAENATQTGDQIGTVTMRSDRSLHMRLRSVECDGTILEGEMTIPPDRSDYQSILDHVGDLKPTETKPVKAWPTKPCSSK
jgi:hypothetical protein